MNDEKVDVGNFIVKIPKKELTLEGDTTVLIRDGKRIIAQLRELGVDVPNTVKAFLEEVYEQTKTGDKK